MSQDPWIEVAERVGGAYVRASGRGAVRLNARGGTIWLESFRRNTAHDTTEDTRVVAVYTSLDDFAFSFGSSTPLQKVFTFLGAQDVEVGDPTFDRAFVIRANDVAKAKSLLGDETVRQLLLQAHEDMWLTVRCQPAERGAASPMLSTQHEIVWERLGFERDMDRLCRIVELFRELLGRLCDIGSAQSGSHSDRRDPER
jgi:hypothetical protein